MKKTAKKMKITKLLHACVGYASTYVVKTLNSFNLELQLKNPESATINKLKYLITELRGFKFVTTLV